jgi:hypothetical protein
MDKQKRSRALIAFVISLLLIAILATILFAITLWLFPDISRTSRLIFSVIGAAILSAAGFFSGLKDTYDFVVGIIDDFFSVLPEDSQKESPKNLQKSANIETFSESTIASAQENIVAAVVGERASLQAENIAGRDINIFNFSTPPDSPTTVSVLSNQLDKLGSPAATCSFEKCLATREKK